MNFIYEYFAAKVRQQMVRELLESVPDKVRNPALRIFADERYKIERMLMFMASELHRKMIYDRKNSVLYEGQLIQIKHFLSMMEVAIRRENPVEETKKKDTLNEKAKEGIKNVFNILKERKSGRAD